MTLVKGKKLIAIGATMLPLVAVGTLFFTANNAIRPSKASAFTMSLNATNAPTLNNGEGTMVDEKNVTWEYHNASALNNGHVTLNHQGYFGVSSSSDWGYTAISELTVNFTSGTDGELWLLTSIDGVDWQEQIKLTSGSSTDWANDWRYIRFYCWDDNNDPINVSSVSFGYECTGISSSDDVDLASIDNVASSSNLTLSKETSDLSPVGNSQEAIRLTKNGNNGYCEFYLKETRNIWDFHTKLIEFDFYHKNNNSKPNVGFWSTSLNKNIGTTASWSGTKSNYKVSNINSDWWHIQIQITSMVAPSVGHADSATKNDPVDKIRITSNNCIIDNLRIDCTPSNADCPLGIYNNGTGMSNGGYYWMKVSWSGILHSNVFTFDVPGIAEQEQNAAHQFYLHGLGTGTVVVTANLVVGYDRRTITISNTITVS